MRRFWLCYLVGHRWCLMNNEETLLKTCKHCKAYLMINVRTGDIKESPK